ncbi:MAG: MFS transporter [Ignavibacteriales bacterium]|nr:MAG: MFS transporter [Ignavibacteriales bacterium]
MNDWKKVFIIIWTGQLFSTLSSAVVGYAVVFWLSVQTGSAEVLAFTTMATLGPQLIFGLFTGVLIDRWDRKTTMITADLFIAVCSIVLAVLFYFGKAELGYIYLILALRSIGAAFHVPAMQASIPLLAPESKLMRISGINQVIHSISTIAGPALAALFITVLNMSYVLMFDVLGAVMACGALMLVKIPNPPKKEDAQAPHLFREMKEGLKEVYGKPGLLWLFIYTLAVMFFLMPVAVLFPLMTLNHFSGNTYMMSIVEIAWGLGMLAGGLLMGIQKLKVNRIILINLMYLIIGFTFAGSGVLSVNSFWIFVALTFICGISGAIYSGAFTVVIQTTVDAAALGRVFSIYGSVTMLPSMIGLLQTGLIADRIGITNTFIISGVAIMLIGIISFYTPSVNEMKKKQVVAN